MSKYDSFRTSLFYSDYQKLKKTFDATNPFLSVPQLKKTEAEFLFNFIKPPTRKSYLINLRQKNAKGNRKKRKFGPKTLIFIVDALEKLSKAKSLISSKTQFSSEQINAELIELERICNIALNYFDDLSNKYPTLSFKKYLKAFRKHFSEISEVETKLQIKRALKGIHTPHPIYASFLQPLIELPTTDKQEFLVRHNLINAVIWNSYLFDRFRLSSHSTVEQALRSITSNDLNAVTGFRTAQDRKQFLTVLRQANNDKFKDIISFIERLDKSERSKTENTSNKRNSQNKRKPYEQNYWIEVDDQTHYIALGEEEDELSLIRQSPRLNKNPNIEINEEELYEDTAEGEIIDFEVLQETPDQATPFPEAKLVNLANKFRHIENFNQFLKDELTPTEVKQILEYAQNKSTLKSTSANDLRAIILITISLCTGYNLHQTHYLRWLEKKPQRNDLIPNLSEACDLLHLPIPRYEYLNFNHERIKYYYESSPTISLPLPSVVQSILKNCLSSYYQKNEKNYDCLSSKDKQKTLQRALKRTLEDIGLDRRVTITLIQNNLPVKALRHANGDLWTISLLSGREDIVSSTHKHYTTIDPNQVLNVYQKSVKEIFGEEVEIPAALNAKIFSAVGNPFRPQKHFVANWLNEVSDYLKPYMEQEIKKLDSIRLIHNMNLVTCYFETYTSYLTGSRNVTNPYIYKNQVLQSGFVTLNDKNIGNGYNTHSLYIPIKIRKLQSQFEDWMWKAIRALRRRKLLKIESLFDESLNTKHFWKSLQQGNYRFPGFFLIDITQQPDAEKKRTKPVIKLTPYTRGNVHKTLLDQSPKLALPVSLMVKNANRHFVRSSLLERAVNPEYIDELLGHRHLGTETWNHSSLFNPKDYQESIKQAVEAMLKDFKVHSPFESL